VVVWQQHALLVMCSRVVAVMVGGGSGLFVHHDRRQADTAHVHQGLQFGTNNKFKNNNKNN
jgi:ABC-type proline/glycine betaine transport system permease subunit